MSEKLSNVSFDCEDGSLYSLARINVDSLNLYTRVLAAILEISTVRNWYVRQKMPLPDGFDWFVEEFIDKVVYKLEDEGIEQCQKIVKYLAPIDGERYQKMFWDFFDRTVARAERNGKKFHVKGERKKVPVICLSSIL